MMYAKKLENFYLWGIKVLIFLIPLLPLYVSSSMVFPHITGKNFAFRILVEFAVALWLGLMAWHKEYRPKNTTMLTPILIFTFVVGLADLLGVNPYRSFWSKFEWMEGYITILHLVLYFMVIKSILKTKKDWIVIFNIFFIVSVLVSLYALLHRMVILYPLFQRFRHIDTLRAYGTIGHPSFLASYLILAIFLGLILIFKTQKPYLKCLYIFSILLNLLVIYFTGTRGVILTAFFGVMFFSLFYIPKKLVIFKRIAFLVLGVVVILPVVFWALRDINFIKQEEAVSRFAIPSVERSVKSRLEGWKIAWEGIKNKPFLGWGQENFINVYTVTLLPFSYTEGVWTDRAHNIILDWLINAGFLGLLSFLTIFGVAFYIIWRTFHKDLTAKNEAVTLITALVVYFVQNLFIFDTINTYILFFTLLAYIDNLDYFEKTFNSRSDISSKTLLIKSIGVSIFSLLVFSVIAYFINYKPIRVAQMSNQISVSYPKYTSFLPLLDDFKKALSYKTFGDTDVRLMMATVCDQIFNYKLFEREGSGEFIKTTVKELERLVTANRHNLLYWLYLIDLYNRIAFYEPSFISKTETLIKEYMQVFPKNHWVIYPILADNFVLKRDYESAFLTMNKAVALNPQSDAMQLKLALAAILTSRDDITNIALEKVKKIRKLKNVDITDSSLPPFTVEELLLLAQTSMEVKNFTRALEFYKEILLISPNEAKYHFDIAKVYLALGDKRNALKEAKKALELDPLNYNKDVKKFINSLQK